MDEKTTAQNVDNQDDVFEAPDAGFDAFEDDVEFDMSQVQATEELFEQQQTEEMSQFKEIEGFASIFPDKWALIPPTDKAKGIIEKTLKKKKVGKRA